MACVLCLKEETWLPFMNAMENSKVIAFLCKELSINFQSFEERTIDPPLRFPVCEECNEMYFQVVKIFNILEEVRGQLKTIVECMKAKVIESEEKKVYPFLPERTSQRDFQNCQLFRNQIIHTATIGSQMPQNKKVNQAPQTEVQSDFGALGHLEVTNTESASALLVPLPIVPIIRTYSKPEVLSAEVTKSQRIHSCAVPSCTSEMRQEAKNLTFHRFPTAQHRRHVGTAWINIIRDLNGIKDWEPSTTDTLICSRHFEGKEIISSGLKQILSCGAVPKKCLTATATVVNFESQKSDTEGGKENEGKEEVFVQAYKDSVISSRARRRNSCIIPSCTSVMRREAKNLTLHCFPTAHYRQHVRTAWIKIIRDLNGIYDWEPPTGALICSRHFEEKEIISSCSKQILSCGAVPTKCLRASASATVLNSESQKDDDTKTGEVEVEVKKEVFTQEDEDVEEFLSNDPGNTETINQSRQSFEFDEQNEYGPLSHHEVSNTESALSVPLPILPLLRTNSRPYEHSVREMKTLRKNICAIPSCTSKLRQEMKNLSLHRFPSGPSRQHVKNAWINVVRGLNGIKDWEPPTYGTVICSRHFEEKEFICNGSRRTLCGAIPTKYLTAVTDTTLNSESHTEATEPNPHNNFEIVEEVEVKEEELVQNDNDDEESLPSDEDILKEIFKDHTYNKCTYMELEYEEAELYGNPELEQSNTNIDNCFTQSNPPSPSMFKNNIINSKKRKLSKNSRKRPSKIFVM